MLEYYKGVALEGRRNQAMDRAKRKLLVILGAGSSLPCGMPGLSDIDALMKKWSRNWKPPIGFPNPGDGTFNDVWKLLEVYQALNPRPQLGLGVNFERVLGEMTALASWVSPSPFGNALRSMVADGRTGPGFTWPGPDEDEQAAKPYYYRHLIIEQLSTLLSQLAEHMRERCRTFDERADNFVNYRAIFEALEDHFEVGIYNLNYDNLAVRAMPDAFTGFTDGRFDPKEVASRGDWNFIYHLHGNVHYSLPPEPAFVHVPIWQNDLRAVFDDSRPLEVNMASNFVPIVPSTLIAGGYKLDQLLADPAQTLYASLVRHIQQADCVLIAGYGFGDVHVNRTLKNRFSRSPYDPGARPPVMLLTSTPKTGLPIGGRQGHEFLSWEFTHSVNTRFPEAGNLSELIAQGRFEEDYHHRAWAWHGGFLEARSQMNEIAERLNR